MVCREVKQKVEPKTVRLLHASILKVAGSWREQHRNLLKFLLQCPLDVVIVCANAHISDAHLPLKYLDCHQRVCKVCISVQHDKA